MKRLDFSDAQGGNVPCDRKAASIKSHMKIHLNQGSNIETAKEMVVAIRSSGGVPGVVYNNGSLTVWRAYGIGPGKCIRL